MADLRGTLRVTDELFTGSTFKNILYNYSQGEVGFRHPDGPVGAMARDQGVLDFYSGRSRQLMTTDGKVLMLAKNWGVKADRLNFRAPSITDFLWNGKNWNSLLFNGRQIASLKNSVPKNLGFVTSELVINLESGRIQSGFVSFKDVIEPLTVFEENMGTKLLPSAEERRYVLWSKLLVTEN